MAELAWPITPPRLLAPALVALLTPSLLTTFFNGATGCANQLSVAQKKAIQKTLTGSGECWGQNAPRTPWGSLKTVLPFKVKQHLRRPY